MSKMLKASWKWNCAPYDQWLRTSVFSIFPFHNISPTRMLQDAKSFLEPKQHIHVSPARIAVPQGRIEKVRCYRERRGGRVLFFPLSYREAVGALEDMRDSRALVGRSRKSRRPTRVGRVRGERGWRRRRWGGGCQGAAHAGEKEIGRSHTSRRPTVEQGHRRGRVEQEAGRF
jgi:hypothetical protein